MVGQQVDDPTMRARSPARRIVLAGDRESAGAHAAAAARPVRRPYRTCRRLLYRKFFYVFTCEYCFSHYVALFFMLRPAIACSFPTGAAW